MNPKYRALIWEQRQVAGAIAMTCFVVASILMGILNLLDAPESYSAWRSMGAGDGPEISLYVAIGMSILAAWLCVLGLDPRGHLNFDFDMRLARLPVATVPLVLIALGVRTAILLLLGAALWLVYGALFGEHYPGYWILAAAEIYLVLQALAWSRRSITGLSYPIGLVVVALLLLRIRSGSGGDLEDFVRAAFLVLASPVALLLTIPVALGLSLAGVYWLRRDEQHGLPAPADLISRIRFRGERRDAPFASALSAQVWYEWQRSGWVLPGLSALLWCMLLLVWGALRDGNEYDGILIQFLPYIAVVVAAMLAGLSSGVPQYRRRIVSTPFHELRPLAVSAMANAKLLVKARSLFLTMSGAFVLSTGGLFLFGHRDMEIFSLAWHEGFLRVPSFVVFLTAPALLAAALAWMLLWINIGMVVALVLVFYAIIVLLSVLDATLFDGLNAGRHLRTVTESLPDFYWDMSLALSSCFIFLVAVALCIRCRAASRGQVLVAVALWLGVGGFVAFRELDYPWLGLNVLFSLAVAAPFAWPFVKVPFDLQRQRSR